MGLGLLWAVLAAVASNMIIGMLWYGPLFGKAWMRSRGMGELTEAQKKEMAKTAMPGYMVSMASAAVATVVLWFLFDWTTSAPEAYSPIMKGAVLGFSAWLALYVGPSLTSRFFEDVKLTTWLIGAGYWGVLAVLYGVYVGLFA